MNTLPELDNARTMQSSPTLMRAVLTARCPQCRDGAIFIGPWHRSNFLHVHEHCTVCDANLIPEPGFYTGAMYVNYAFNIVQLTIVGLFTWLVINPDNLWWIVGAVVGVTFLTIPFTARASRVIWLHMFGSMSYDPTTSKD